MPPKKSIAGKKTDRLPAAELPRQTKAGRKETDAQQLIHELEMRNESLIRSQAETQAILRQYADLYDFAPIGYFTLSRDGVIRQANLNGAGLLGMDRDRLIRQNFVLFVSPEFCSIFDSFLEKIFSDHGEQTCEIMLLKKKHESIWVRIKATYSDVSYEQGSCHLVVSDITEHKHAENIQQAHFRITEFAAEHSLGDLLQNALDELCNLTDSPIGFFHFVEPDQRTLSLQVWSTRTLKEMCTAEGKGQHYDIDQAGVWVDCVRKKRPVIHNDYASLPVSRRKGLPQGHATIVREMIFPIIRNEKIVAVIGVGNKLLDYTQRDVAYALRFADLIWDITERKRAEKALRESEARYLSILEDQTELICRYLPDGRLSFVNEAYARYYGETAQRLINTNFIPQIPEPDISMVINKISEITPQEPSVVYEHRIIKRDGEIRWQTWTHRGIYDADGNLIEHQAVGNDITEQKRAEDALQASQQQLERQKLFLEAMLSAMPIPVFYKDTQGRYLGCNRAYAESLGIELAEFIGKTVYDLWPHELAETYHRMDMELFENPGPQIYEFKVRNKSGEMRDVIFRKDVFRNEDGSIGGIIGTHFDITERKRVEEALRESEEKFRSLFDNASVGMFRTRLDGSEILDMNEGFLKIFGRTREEIQGSASVILWTDPREREKLLRRLDAEERVVDFECGMLNKQGEVRNCLISLQHYRSRGILEGSILDITERKRAEEELHRHLSELEVLYDNGLAISALLEPREIGRKIIETLSRNLSWHHIAIRLRRGETDNLELIAFNQPNLGELETTEVEKRLNAVISKIGQGLSGWSVQIGQAIRTGNVREHPQYVDTFSGVHSGMYMPLTVGERVIGCISVESEAEDAFTEQDERLLATLAAQTATAFENARLYQNIQQELRERERAEAALANEKAFTETALDSQRDTFFVFEPVSGRAIHWNKIFRDITGYSDEEITSLKAPDSYFSPEDLEKAAPIFESIMLNGYGRIELYLICKDGRRIPVEYEVSLIQEKTGETNYIITIGRDVTERKQAEEQIQLLAKFPAEDPNPVLRVARDGTLRYVNEAGLSLLPQWDMQVGKAIPPILREAVSQSMSNGTTQTLDIEHGDRLFAFYVSPIVSAGYANLYGHDITESRQVKALQDAEARYHVLFEQSPYGVLLADFETGKIIEANEIASRQLGYTREEFAKMKIFDYEASEKPEQIAQHTQKILHEGSDDFETLHHTKSGEIRNVHVWVKTLLVNERILFYAILQDITERKRMEEANEAYNREITLLEERQRIASDLHDAVSQTLFSARLTTEMLLRQPDRQSDSFTHSLMDLNRLARSAAGELRLILIELRNNALLNVSLNTLLADLIDSGMARTSANLIFQCHVDELALPPQIKLAFYRIAQEAVSNAIKHGKPANINCILQENAQTLEMIIRDDGTGFSVDKVSDDHFGMQIMRERADQAEVGLTITTQPGNGTSVTVWWQEEKHE